MGPITEPHAPKGQRTLFDVSCTKRKLSKTDGQPRELWIRLDPDIARWFKEHEKQQAAVIAARPPPPLSRPLGRLRKLPVLRQAQERTPVSQAMEVVAEGEGGREGLSL